jgi:membrane-bound lytic murein transglycosylase B
LKKGDYSGNISTLAIRKCREFLKQNRGALEQAEKKYKVPGEVITALLWVETKHGKIMGNLSITNVYLNLAMADHPKLVERSLELLKEQVWENDPSMAEYIAKVKERSKLKSEWAVDQLMALNDIQAKRHWDVFSIQGSFAGAFGLPQFIPTSYLESAAGPVRKGKRDLFNSAVAIHSVGNFLKKKGWGKGRKKRELALYEYNRSKEYGATILELADLIKAGK